MYTMNTPLKEVKNIQHIYDCILCGKPPSGKMRLLFRNANDSANVPLLKLSEVFGLQLNKLKGTGCKYCLSCYNMVEKVHTFKSNLVNLIETPNTSTPVGPHRFKRMLVNTPTPIKGRSCRRKLPQVESFDDHTYQRSMPVANEASFAFKTGFNILDESLSSDYSQFLIETDTVLDNLCSLSREPGPSCLRIKPERLGKEDVVSNIILELTNSAPKLLQVLQLLCSPLSGLKDKSKATVAMMYAMGMYCRNKDLNAVQTLLTCASMDCHANNRLLQILNKSSLCLAITSKVPLLDKLAKINTHGIVNSLKSGIRGKITADNIDGRTIANQVRLLSGNRDYHYTASTYLPDRCQLEELTDDSSISTGQNINIFFIQPEEELIMKNCLKVMVGRVLIAYCPELEWMKKCIPDHIQHRYTEEMSIKSEVYPLKVIMKDPKYTGQCVEVLQETKEALYQCYVEAGLGEEFSAATIPLGGDQLVRVRMKSALGLLRGAHTIEERLDMFHPVIIEMFHTQQDYLDKLFAKHWNNDTVRSPGTLANLKAVLRRSSVTGDVKRNFRAHDDFLLTITEAYLLSLALDHLQMKETTDKPNINLPQNINRMHIKNREKYSNDILNDLVNKIYETFQQEDKPHVINVFVHGVGQFCVELDMKLYKPGNLAIIDIPGTSIKFHYRMPIPSSESNADHLYNYGIHFLRWSMLYIALDDAIREGDPFRLNITLKAMLPFFFSHSHLSKYAVEIVDYVMKTEALLTPRMAMRVRLGGFVNTKGGIGKNKAADMQQENNVKMTKRVIKGLGAYKTDKAISRASAAAPPVSIITDHYQNILKVHLQARDSVKKSRHGDVIEVLDILNNLKVFVHTPGRCLRGFEFSSNPLVNLDKQSFSEFLRRTSERVCRSVRRNEE